MVVIECLTSIDIGYWTSISIRESTVWFCFVAKLYIASLELK